MTIEAEIVLLRQMLEDKTLEVEYLLAVIANKTGFDYKDMWAFMKDRARDKGESNVLAYAVNREVMGCGWV